MHGGANTRLCLPRVSVGTRAGARACDAAAHCVHETGEDGTHFHTPLWL